MLVQMFFVKIIIVKPAAVFLPCMDLANGNLFKASGLFPCASLFLSLSHYMQQFSFFSFFSYFFCNEEMGRSRNVYFCQNTFGVFLPTFTPVVSEHRETSPLKTYTISESATRVQLNLLEDFFSCCCCFVQQVPAYFYSAADFT